MRLNFKSFMRKTLPLLGSLGASLALPSQAYSSCDIATISGHPNYPPYQWKHEDKIVGASIDIARKIFEEQNIIVRTPYVGPWKRVLNKAEQGSIDMVVALKNTEERRQYLVFNDTPFYVNPFVIWVRKGKEFSFNNWEDLIGRQGGKNLGDRYGGEFDEFLKQNLTITSSRTVASNFKMLIFDRNEYYIHGLYPGMAYITVNNMTQDFTALEKPINTGYIHNAFSKKSKCIHLTEIFNKRLREMLDSGETKAAMDRNIALWKEHNEAAD